MEIMNKYFPRVTYKTEQNRKHDRAHGNIKQ